MRRWTIRILVGLFGLIVVTALTGATYQWFATRKDLAATPPPGHLVDIGGYRLHLWCTGDGAPVVILDAGLGGTSAGWGFVQPEVARFTRVCSYDRAGMGYSDPGPSPRTARRIANELAELLARSGMAGPVVLVGESIAGFDVRLFASDHPERAAGLVLVDASHEDDTHEVPGMARFVPLLSTIGSFSTAWRVVRPESRVAGSISAPIRAGDELSRRRIPGGGRRNHSHSGDRIRSQELAPQAHHSCPSRHRCTRSRRELATAATGSSVAVRTRMSDHRSTVRSRCVGRPTGDRRGRDPDCRGDSQRPRCSPLRHTRCKR